MYLMACITVVLCFLVWAVVYRLRVLHPLDPLAIMMYIVLLRYVVRPAVLAMQLDRAHPDYLFAAVNTEQWIILGEIYFAIWLIAMAFGAGLPFGLTKIAHPLFPRVSRDVSMYRAFLTALLCTVVSATAFWMLNKGFGGLEEMIFSLKVEKETTGLAALRNCAVLGAFISAGFALRLIQKRWHGEPSISPLFIPLALAMMAFNGFFMFACGSRSTAVFSVVCFVMGLTIYRRNTISWSSLVTVAGVFVGMAIALRLARDYLVWGHVSSAIEGETPIRQAFVMTNCAYFDAFMLILRDWSDPSKMHWGQDFLNGIYAPIPRAFWPAKPPFLETPGSILRSAYEDYSNGWPPGAVGEWYWNFGVPGVIVGGILTGVLFRVLQVRYGDFLRNPFSLVLIVFFVVRMLDTGIVTQTFSNYLTTLPLLLVITFLMYAPDRQEKEFDDEPMPQEAPAEYS